MNIRICKGGFPHSEIPGSKVIRTSSGLIAAYHVFHSLCAPRHSLNALVTLDSSDFLEMVTSTYRPYIAVTNKIVWRSCAVNNTFIPDSMKAEKETYIRYEHARQISLL